jgi:SAM-dependent methyltransferase
MVGEGWSAVFAASCYDWAVRWRDDPRLFDDEVRPRLLAPSAELLLDALPPLSPQMRVLEVQAGGGLLSRGLVERIAGLGRLVLVDDDLTRAPGLPAVPRRVSRAVSSPLSLPFKDGAFDVVLDGTLDIDGVGVTRLAELRRVTRPGGFVLVAVLLKESFQRLLDVAADLAEGRRLPAVIEAVAGVRDTAPSLDELRGMLIDVGVTVAHVGVEDRLLGLYDGAALRHDRLLNDVVLAGVQAAAPVGFLDAVAGAVDGWCPDGLAVIAKTAVVSGRVAR